MQNITHDLDTSELSSYDPSKIKIIIGVTGKIDSIVSAFLLQKQGFQCVAVGILNWQDPKYNFSLDQTCSVNNLEEVKSMCEKINVPFYAVDAQKEFKEIVVNQMVADKLGGLAHWPCLECHKLKINILYEKMKKLGAHFIATGHYAKCYKNHSTQSFSIHSATDRNFDQSALLSGVNQDVLRKLILPLAELSRTEVIKLATKFNFNPPKKKDSNEALPEPVCFGESKEFQEYITSHVPQDLRPVGPVMDYYTKVPLAEHQGLYHFKIAEINPKAEKEEKVVVSINSTENTVYKGYLKDFDCDYFQLVNVELPKDTDLSKPMSVYCKFGSSSELTSGEIKFKNNHSMVLQLSKKIHVIPQHEVVTLYNKEGSAAKVIGSGKILFMGEFQPIDRTLKVHEVARDEYGKPIKEELTPLRIGFKF
jgi:tRNA-specific 2-thiouridylase